MINYPQKKNAVSLNLSSTLQSILRKYKDKFSRHQVSLVYHKGTTPPFNLSRAHLEQVIIILLNNAFDALKNHKGRQKKIEIRTGNKNKVVFLEIEDNGKGILSGNREKIFDPLFTTKLRGTGMGLYLASTIVKSFNGQLFLKNKGTPTIFRINFQT